MPAVAEPPTIRKESPAEKLQRYRRENAVPHSRSPRPEVAREERSPDIAQQKIDVFEDWADLRERVDEGV